MARRHQAMQTQWVPLWVMAAGKKDSGNPELIRRGAKPWDAGNFSQLFGDQTTKATVSQATAHRIIVGSHHSS